MSKAGEVIKDYTRNMKQDVKPVVDGAKNYLSKTRASIGTHGVFGTAKNFAGAHKGILAGAALTVGACVAFTHVGERRRARAIEDQRAQAQQMQGQQQGRGV